MASHSPVGFSYGLSDLGGAATFASSVYTSGVTDDINLLDVVRLFSGFSLYAFIELPFSSPLQSSGTHYLAGLIEKNQPLGDGTSDAMTAILGQSLATNPGDSPQADKDPSITGRDAETAIWSYDRTNDDLTATWVNYNGQIPASTTAYISYISSRDEFYLTNSRTAPSDGSPVVRSSRIEDFVCLRVIFSYSNTSASTTSVVDDWVVCRCYQSITSLFVGPAAGSVFSFPSMRMFTLLIPVLFCPSIHYTPFRDSSSLYILFRSMSWFYPFRLIPVGGRFIVTTTI